MVDANKNIRKPAVAGLFYPGGSVELSKTIAGFYAEVEKTPLGGPPMGLIASATWQTIRSTRRN